MKFLWITSATEADCKAIEESQDMRADRFWLLRQRFGTDAITKSPKLFGLEIYTLRGRA